MNGNQVKKSDGTVINCEIISYFEMIDSAKRYIFYSMNEPVEGGLVKLYASEVDANKVVTGNITDDDWNKIKSVMKAILTNSNPNIKYLNWEE